MCVGGMGVQGGVTGDHVCEIWTSLSCFDHISLFFFMNFLWILLINLLLIIRTVMNMVNKFIFGCFVDVMEPF